MAKKSNRLKQEKTSAGEIAHVSAKVALAAVPVVGGSLAELFAYLINDPVEKRRDEWIEEIAARIEELEEQLGKPIIDGLRNDEKFTTVLLSASQIAIRNHQMEKIEALVNAVLNAALGKIPDDTERSIMLSLIDRLTPSHLAILALMRAPRENAMVMKRVEHISMGGLTLVIFAAFPQLSGRGPLAEMLWRELVDTGLLISSGLNVTMSRPGLLEKRTTTFGDKFLDFIRNPLNEE